MDEQRQQDIEATLLEDAELAFEKLALEEVELVKETEELFKKQVDYIKLIDNLQNYIPNMKKLDMDKKRLSNLVDSSSALVEEACGRIRQIDLAKARLDDCLARVTDVLDLKTCREGIVGALGEQKYEEAAMHIKRYLSIDQDELKRTISIINTKQPGLNHVQLDSSRDIEVIDHKFMIEACAEMATARFRLLSLCRENLSKAIKEGDTRNLERYFKIFPMLNEYQDGLNRYAQYLQGKVVTAQLDEILRSKNTKQADKLAALYESNARLIEASRPLVETHYGPGHLIIMVTAIQKECDRLSRKILEEFRNATKLQQVARQVKSASLQATAPSVAHGNSNSLMNTAPSKLDPREVDNILNEIALIISRTDVYLNFIVDLVKEDVNVKADTEAQKKSSLLDLYNLVCRECELNHLSQEVSGIYVMLEQFYLNESSKKAIQMDQIDVESTSCYVSSMLDDIFFIIKKCTKRAISTKSNEVFCAIINHCVTLLESTFYQVIEERLKSQPHAATFTSKNMDLSQAYSAIQSGRYLQSNSELELAKARYFSALNNLSKACDYIKTLRKILDNDIKKLRPSLHVIQHKMDSQLEKSQSCLNELSLLVNKFTSLASSSLYQLFNVSLRNRIRSELKAIIADNPDLATADLSERDELASLATDLLSTLDRSLKSTMTSDNYSKLVSITKDFLTSSISSLK